jgi:hypothetical protein
VIAIAYVFLIEVFVGRLPGIVKRISVSFYTWSAVYGGARPLGVEPLERSFFRPMDGDAAHAILAGLAAAFLVLGAILFSRREHADPA